MSFSDSSSIKIPLSDPLVKYGKTFRVSNIYLTSSSSPQSSYNLPSSSSSLAIYQQNFESQYLGIEWNIIDPGTDYIYIREGEIKKNPYVSGFNVYVYENSGNATGANVITGRNKVFEKKGVTENNITYKITGEGKPRNYSIDVEFVDFTGNKSKGMLTSVNPVPQFSITGTGVTSGFFNAYYSGRMNSNNVDISEGLGAVSLYLFTGLTSGESGLFSQDDYYFKRNIRSATSSETQGVVSIELEPGLDSYIMAIGSDQYSTGEMSGIYAPRQYITGIGFSGLTGDLNSPALIPNPIRLNQTGGQRIEAASGLYYEFQPSYNTGTALIENIYGIRSTGQTTGAVSGYSGEIYFDSGVLYNTDYNTYNTGNSYTYDNALSLEVGFNTGVTIEKVESTGSGITGYITEASGAGSYWASGFPRYRSQSSGYYTYGYYDGYKNQFACASQEDVRRQSIQINGIYSLPKGDPNNYEIKFRSGYNFTQSYEQAATYLNQMGEMPAVILNNSQLTKIQSLNAGRGWVGLRRGRVSLLSGLFSDKLNNDAFFNETDFTKSKTTGIQALNTSGKTENNALYVNDVGENWSWVNESGSAIYKYAGSGYNKIRTSTMNIDVRRILPRTGYYMTADQFGDSAYLLTQEGGIINLEDDTDIGLQMEGYYYPLYLTPDEVGFPTNVYVINGRRFYTPINKPLTKYASLPSPNIYKQYIDPLITGQSIEVGAPPLVIENPNIESGGLQFLFFPTLKKKYMDPSAPADTVFANNWDATNLVLHTGTSSGFIPSSDNLYTGMATVGEVMPNVEANNQSLTVSFSGTRTGENPNIFKLIPYDAIGSGEVYMFSGDVDLSMDSQTMVVDLDPYSAGLGNTNLVDVIFPYAHSAPPAVTYMLGYTGTTGPLACINAMLSGTASTTGASFILTAPPPGTGYVLNIDTAV